MICAGDGATSFVPTPVVERLTHIGLPFPYHTDLPRSEGKLLEAFENEAGAFFRALGCSIGVVRLPRKWRDPSSRSRLRVQVKPPHDVGAMYSFSPSIMNPEDLRGLLSEWGFHGSLYGLHFAMRARNSSLDKALPALRRAGYKPRSSGSAGPSHKSWYVEGPWGYIFELQILNAPH